MFPRRLLGILSLRGSNKAPLSACFSAVLGVLLGFLILLSMSCCRFSATESESDAASKRLLLTFEGNTGSIGCVVYSPDGKLIASCHEERPGSSDSADRRIIPSGQRKKVDVHREIMIWNPLTGKVQISVNKGYLAPAVAFYPDSRSLAGAVRNMVMTWDSTTGKDRLLFKGHTDIVKDLDISRNGKWLATASLDGTVKVWNALTGDCLHTIKGHERGVFHVSFSPDGERIAGTGGDRDRKGEIRIWDWASEKQVLSIPHDSLMGKALFCPDSKHLACYRDEMAKSRRPGMIEVWEPSSGRLLFREELHSDEVTCIAYSPHGKFLASGSQDGTVIVGDGDRGKEILKLTTHKNGTTPLKRITSIAFNPQGGKLATASWDGTVKIWDIKDVTVNK